ncbi:hypothetical protein TNCV_344931 [Trichonephila clavipes]|nr:hypothetical protein TNCV_344931 [Trichonephila clavipes]
MRTELHPGVAPPTTESNKGGSVPVIWQKTRHGAYLEVHPEYNATASGRGSNGSRLTGAGSNPATRLQHSVGQNGRESQDTIFLLTGRRTRQTCGSRQTNVVS